MQMYWYNLKKCAIRQSEQMEKEKKVASFLMDNSFLAYVLFPPVRYLCMMLGKINKPSARGSCTRQAPSSKTWEPFIVKVSQIFTVEISVGQGNGVH